MPLTWRKVLLLHVIGPEGSASASENRASDSFRAHACYRLRLTTSPSGTSIRR